MPEHSGRRSYAPERLLSACQVETERSTGIARADETREDVRNANARQPLERQPGASTSKG